MNLRQRTLKGAFWSSIGKWSDKLISTAIFFVLARLLAVGDFGLVALATVIITFIETLVEQGFAQAIIQREKVESEHLDTAFWSGFGISIILTIVIVLVAGPVSTLFTSPQLAPIIRWLSLCILFKGFNSVQETVLRRDLDFKAISIRRIITNLMGGAIGISLAWAGYGVWSLVGKQLVDAALGIPLLWSISNWRPSLRFSAKHFHELFSFQISIVGLRFFSFLSQHSTNLLIGYFLGTVALGYYNIAYRLIAIVLQVTTSATTEVMESAFARLQQEPERLKRNFYKTTEILSLINIPAFLGMALLAPEFVPMFFGEHWSSSIPVIQVLALMGIVESTNFINGSLIIASGKPSWYLKIRCIDFVFSTLMFLLVFRSGIVAVATADMIRNYLIFPLMLIAVHKTTHIEIKKYFIQFSAPLFCSLIMSIAMAGVQIFLLHFNNPNQIVLTCGILGMFVYAISLVLVKPYYLREVQEFTKKIIKSKTS
jgi:O-antigen/teichoic acid export membrane protein